MTRYSLSKATRPTNVTFWHQYSLQALNALKEGILKNLFWFVFLTQKFYSNFPQTAEQIKFQIQSFPLSSQSSLRNGCENKTGFVMLTIIFSTKVTVWLGTRLPLRSYTLANKRLWQKIVVFVVLTPKTRFLQ